MASIIEDGKDILEDFESFMNKSLAELNEHIQIKDLACRRILEDSDETLHAIEAIVARFRETIPNGTDMNLIDVREFLRNQVEQQSKRQEVEETERLDLKLKQSALDIKITDLKKEIDKLNEENQQMVAKLAEPELPLVLKLMSSKNF